MKKLYAIVIALICSLLCILGLDLFVKKELGDSMDKAVYYNTILSRNCSDYVMDQIITEDSIVVLGSSELSASDNLAYPPALFNQGYSDFNMILMGAGHLQSLAQAINVGALQNNIKNNKVVLIVSPQWFTEAHLSSEAFSGRFQEANFVEFLRNDNITKQTKIAVADRVNELLTADVAALERVNKYEDIYLHKNLNPIKYCEMMIYSSFRDAKLRFQILGELNERNVSIDYNNFVEADLIDYTDLLLEAEKLGKEACTNNEYGVYDQYFEKYIQDGYEGYKGYYAEQSFCTSPEYDDFRLFLDVCKETGIEPLIVNVPVNGRWYDYTGFPNEDRNTYYQNIRDICDEYGVEIADFSDKEYELYFLKDIMHIGWKGWVYLDEAVYNFYKK